MLKDIPKHYNWKLEKTQDDTRKDIYLFSLRNRETDLIEQRRSARTPQTIANKIKRVIKNLNK